MKLYFAPGTCSFSPHIVAREAGIALDLMRVDISSLPRRTAGGDDYAAVNPNLYVPALELDDGSVLTEGLAIVLHLADLKPGSGLAPAEGTRERRELVSWLTFIATELHKGFSPWLFHAEYGAAVHDIARQRLAPRLAHVENQLADGRPFLLGQTFTVADAYLFTIVGWSTFTKVDLASYPNLRAYLARVGSRASVAAARAAEQERAAA